MECAPWGAMSTWPGRGARSSSPYGSREHSPPAHGCFWGFLLPCNSLFSFLRFPFPPFLFSLFRLPCFCKSQTLPAIKKHSASVFEFAVIADNCPDIARRCRENLFCILKHKQVQSRNLVICIACSMFLERAHFRLGATSIVFK